jgi:hypothetical protein
VRRYSYLAFGCSSLALLFRATKRVRRLLLLLSHLIGIAIRDVHNYRRHDPDRDPKPPIGGRYCKAECSGNPDRSGSLDALYIEAALEDDGPSRKPIPDRKP